MIKSPKMYLLSDCVIKSCVLLAEVTIYNHDVIINFFDDYNIRKYEQNVIGDMANEVHDSVLNLRLTFVFRYVSTMVLKFWINVGLLYEGFGIA